MSLENLGNIFILTLSANKKFISKNKVSGHMKIGSEIQGGGLDPEYACALMVEFLSFSCSFRQRFRQIKG